MKDFDYVSKRLWTSLPVVRLILIRFVIYILLVVCIYSCAPGYYSYTFSMKESSSPKKMVYENDTLFLKFSFRPMGLMIEIKNNFTEDVNVKWDKLNMEVNGLVKEIEHTQVQLNKIFLEKPPSIVTPKSFCSDLIVYAENIYSEKHSKKSKIFLKHIYPARSNSKGRQVVSHLKGQIITLYFATQINNVDRCWVFNFSLDKIKTFPSLTWIYDMPDKKVSRIFQTTEK